MFTRNYGITILSQVLGIELKDKYIIISIENGTNGKRNVSVQIEIANI